MYDYVTYICKLMWIHDCANSILRSLEYTCTQPILRFFSSACSVLISDYKMTTRDDSGRLWSTVFQPQWQVNEPTALGSAQSPDIDSFLRVMNGCKTQVAIWVIPGFTKFTKYPQPRANSSNHDHDRCQVEIAWNRLQAIRAVIKNTAYFCVPRHSMYGIMYLHLANLYGKCR